MLIPLFTKIMERELWRQSAIGSHCIAPISILFLLASPICLKIFIYTTETVGKTS